MQSQRMDELQLFFELCSDIVIENSMECLEASSLVSYQLENAAIKHEMIRGSVCFQPKDGNASYLTPHYYIQVEVEDRIVIDISLAFWFQEEVENGLPLVCIKNSDDSFLRYSNGEIATEDRMDCLQLQEFAAVMPIPRSIFRQ